MDDGQKKNYLEKYKLAKERGVRFYPDIIYKDLLVSLAVFMLLLGLAIFVGVVNEPPADPSDTSYIPRPEWYFLFLFELLKYIPGRLEWVGATVIPGIALLILFLLPFIDRNPSRHWRKRKWAVSAMSVIILGMLALTIMAVASTPPQEEDAVAVTLSDQIVAGQDLYSVHCVECHGADGEGGEIKGVEGLEGVIVKPINSQDEMYTRTDETIFNIIEYGQPDLGMPPNGLAYGGELKRGDIQAMVNFIRYTWDDRAELPEEAAQAGPLPTLAPNEVPFYAVHIEPILKRYCVSCHRPGKKNNNYLMGSFEESMTSGDHTPNIIAGDMNSNLLLMINRQEIEAGGPMPPTRALKPELIDIFTRWIAAGAPQTPEEAAALMALTPSAAPEATETPVPTP